MRTQPWTKRTQLWTKRTQPWTKKTQPWTMRTQPWTMRTQPWTKRTQPWTKKTQPWTKNWKSRSVLYPSQKQQFLGIMQQTFRKYNFRSCKISQICQGPLENLKRLKFQKKRCPKGSYTRYHLCCPILVICNPKLTFTIVT